MKAMISSMFKTLSQYHNKKICEKVKSIILLGKGLLSRMLFFKNPTIFGGPCHVACRNLVPQLKYWVLTSGPPGMSQESHDFYISFFKRRNMGNTYELASYSI